MSIMPIHLILVDGWDKDTQNVNLISIPSIFFGSQIKKGSIELTSMYQELLVGTLKMKEEMENLYKQDHREVMALDLLQE